MKPKRPKKIPWPKGQGSEVKRTPRLSKATLLALKLEDQRRRALQKRANAEARKARLALRSTSGLKFSGPQKGSENRPSKRSRKSSKRSSASSAKSERRVGGVMTPNIAPVPGQRVIATCNGSVVTTTVQVVTAYQRILDNIYSTSGNHKTPTKHQFRTRRINYGTGFTHAWTVGNPNFWTRISGNQAVGFGLSDTVPDGQSLVYNKTLSKLYDKVRGDVDLSVDAFQGRQTKAMMSTRLQQARQVFFQKAPLGLKAIGGIISTMRRSNPRDWGSLWLEWTYGWKPLAGSIFGSAEQMILATHPSGGGSSSPNGLPISASSSESTANRATVTNGATPGTRNTKVVRAIYQSKVVAYYSMSSGGIQSVANYTSLNPVSIAWELVPYSFVADWFVNIGGYLRNLESSLLYNSSFTGGYACERSQISVNESIGGGNEVFSCSASGESTTRNFIRNPLGGSPMPRAPTFSLKLSASRLISAASLLSQQLHSLKHRR